MDLSVEYKLLCQAELKLQSIHSPEKGDYWICDCSNCTSPNVMEAADVDFVNQRDTEDVYYLHADMMNLSGDCGFGAFWRERQARNPFGPNSERDKEGRVRMSYVWLPRQDQLQAIILPYFGNDFERMFRVFFRYTETLRTQMKDGRIDTGEKLWLEFYKYHAKHIHKKLEEGAKESVTA